MPRPPKPAETWPEFLRRALQTQVDRRASGKPSSCLWATVGLLKKRFPTWTAGEAWRTVDSTVNLALGGWSAWVDAWGGAAVHGYGETTLDSIGGDFADSWNRHHLITSDVLPDAVAAATGSHLVLPPTEIPRGERYAWFVRTACYMAAFMGTRTYCVSGVAAGLALQADPKTISKWARWACEDGFLVEVRAHVFKGRKHSDNRPTTYRVARVLRDLVAGEIARSSNGFNPAGGAGSTAKVVHGMTLYGLGSPEAPGNSSELLSVPGLASRDAVSTTVPLARQGEPGKKKVQRRWLDLARQIHSAEFLGTKPPRNQNLEKSALELRALHRLGTRGDGRRENAAGPARFRDIQAAVEFYVRGTKEHGGAHAFSMQGYPEFRSGAALRLKWDRIWSKVQLALKPGAKQGPRTDSRWAHPNDPGLERAIRGAVPAGADLRQMDWPILVRTTTKDRQDGSSREVREYVHADGRVTSSVSSIAAAIPPLRRSDFLPGKSGRSAYLEFRAVFGPHSKATEAQRDDLAKKLAPMFHAWRAAHRKAGTQ